MADDLVVVKPLAIAMDDDADIVKQAAASIVDLFEGLFEKMRIKLPLAKVHNQQAGAAHGRVRSELPLVRHSQLINSSSVSSSSPSSLE
jgi:hypothetical protein